MIPTPGGQLLAKRDAESFFFKAYDYLSPIRASIEKFDLSGHADRETLIEYAEQTQAKQIVLTHGEESARNWFSQKLSETLPQAKIIDPQPSRAYSL